jgi:hypothetical protein
VTDEEQQMRASLKDFTTPRLEVFKLGLRHARTSDLVFYMAVSKESPLLQVFNVDAAARRTLPPHEYMAVCELAKKEIACAVFAVADEIDRRFPVPT